MLSEKRHFQILAALGIVIVLALLPLAARAANGEVLPADQFQTNAAGTGTAFRETVNARTTAIAGTAEAFKANAAGTATAVKEKADTFRTNVAATSTAYREKINGTATSFKATSNVFRTHIPGTATAAKATLNAASTNIRATVKAGATNFVATAKAAGTKIATVFAPLAEPKTAIEFYAHNVLGIEVTVVSARKTTSSDVRRFSNTDSGGQINQIGLGLASVSNYATLSNGEAMVSYGLAGALHPDLQIALGAGSVAVYSLHINDVGTLEADKALTLAKNTYPKLSSLAYDPLLIRTGYGWIYAKDKTDLTEVQASEAGGGMVIFYVTQTAPNKAKVTVTVALGGFAAMSPK